MNIASLEDERNSLVEKIMQARNGNMSPDARMQLHNRVAEIDDILAESSYASMTESEKLAWWTHTTWRQMRMQSESGIDQLALFDSLWLEHALAKEPTMMELLPKVFRKVEVPYSGIAQLLKFRLSSEEWRAARLTIRGNNFV